MTRAQILANDIRAFLATHAKMSAMEPGEYNGPDSQALEAVAQRLSASLPAPAGVWSDWGSGCYRPIWSDAGRKWHDSLIHRIARSQLFDSETGKAIED